MNLAKAIVKDHSKAQCNRIINYVGQDPERLDELVNLFLEGDAVKRQRAGWPLGYVAIRYPHLMRKYFGKLIRNLQRPGLHDAEKRNTVRLLQYMDVPKSFHGVLMNTCFAFISSPAETPAVKVFSMTILHNLCRHYPDIRAELRLVLEDQWQQATPAFRARAKKILKAL